jgi:predicted ester cyclase
MTVETDLSEAQALAIVAPWYSLFTIPGRGSVRAVFDRAIAEDFRSCTGDLPEEARDREASIPFIEALAELIPDMVFDIRELFVVGDRVIVRGEARGTPAGEFFGLPHSGRSFRIMTIDVLTIRDRKITRTYHLENWLGALEQLRGA